MATTIRKNTHLRAIFAISKWTGVWIPEKHSDGHFSKNITVWEVAVHVTISCVFVAIMCFAIRSLPSFKIEHIGSPLVIFLLYSVTLCNAINLIANKNKFALLLKTFDQMTRFHIFGKLHENVVDKLCRRVKIFTFASLMLSILAVSLSFAAFSMLNIDLEKIQQNSTLPKNLTEDEINILQVTCTNFTWTVFDDVIMGLHGIASFNILFKMFITTSFMFLSHEFIIEELHILVAYIKILKNHNMCRVIAFQKSTTQDHWLYFYGKITKYDETILHAIDMYFNQAPLYMSFRALQIMNYIFGIQVMTTVACSTLALSFNALVAAVVC